MTKNENKKTTVCCDMYECTNNTLGVCQAPVIVISFYDDFTEICLNYKSGDDN